MTQKEVPKNISVKQAEQILSAFGMDPREVLPNTAFETPLERRFDGVNNLSITFDTDDHEKLTTTATGTYWMSHGCGSKTGPCGTWLPTPPRTEEINYQHIQK